MRRGGGAGLGGRRLPKSSLAPSSAADATPALDPICRNLDAAFNRRDSDATSLCSSRRPSSIDVGASAAPNFSDRAGQAAALREVNAFLAPAVFLRPPLPPARDIMVAFRLILHRLKYPLQEKDIEDDILFVLRILACPYKLARSALKAPGTPHTWPPLLSVLHWLVMLASICASANPSNTFQFSDLLRYTTDGYALFIEGEDDEVAALDEKYVAKARAHGEAAAEAFRALEKQAQEVEEKRIKLTSAPLRHEALEAQKAAFAEDIKKFEAVVKTWSAKVGEKETSLVNMEEVVEVKRAEVQRLAAENQALLEKVEAQGVDIRDAERMHKEMQLLENDYAKRDKNAQALEEKVWELDAELVRTTEGLDEIVEKCNQALKKLEISIDFQYSINSKASSPAELLGLGYKTKVKPTLKAYIEDNKRISTLMLEESVHLQKQVQEYVRILKEKKNNIISSLQNRTNEILGRLNTLDHEIENDESRCKAETVQMTVELEEAESLISTTEKEAADYLNNAEYKLQEKIRKSEEETQLFVKDLLELLKLASTNKKFVEDSIAERKKWLNETIDYIASLKC